MRSGIKLSKSNRIIAIVLAVTLLLGAAVAVNAALQAQSSDREFDELNPELDFISIQGNAEGKEGISLYDHVSSFTQGDGQYSITTNSFCEWYPEDDVAVAYKYYGVKSNGKDYIELTCDVDYFTNPDGSQFSLVGAHHPSAGIEFRSGLGNTDSFFSIHVRDEGSIYLIYRDPSQSAHLFSCYYQAHDYSLGPESFPITMQMRMQGTSFTARYKFNGSNEWIDFDPITLLNFNSGVYAGLMAHSGTPERSLKGTFSNLHAVGEQSIGTSDGEGNATGATEAVDEDPIFSDVNMLLAETFTDGDLTNGSADSRTNPLWSSIASSSNFSIKNLEGNRMLYCEYGTAIDFIGNETWTDYSASMDFMYDASRSEVADANQVGLIVRSVANLYYGHQNYAAVVEDGERVLLYKTFMNTMPLSGNSTKLLTTVSLPESILLDDRIHNLRVDCMDNIITVYVDGVEIVSYTDEGYIDFGTGGGVTHINSAGGIGVTFSGVHAYVDNITVTKLYDPVGGDYDNSIGGNWDVPVPDYISKNDKS